MSMGLLDDAIREHLELKRQRGTDEAEVQRLAQEALSPPGHGGGYAQAGKPPAAGNVSGEDEPVVADGHVEPAAFSPADHPVMPEPIGYEPLVEAHPAQADPWESDSATRVMSVRDIEQPGRPDDGVAAVPAREPQAAAETPTAAHPPAERAREVAPSDTWLDDDELDPPAQQTTSFSARDVAEAHGASSPPADDDVLEETPDFLQETPEHDRLWFEQKPPRPFDFES